MDGSPPPSAIIVDLVGDEHAPFVASLLRRCTFAAAPVVRCAVSGGPDSLAMLVLARATGADVHAIHVDHPEQDKRADKWRDDHR